MVSVIIPCYNHAHFLTEAIESVLAQTYLNCEIIIVDDGSKDNTRHVARGFGSRVRYVWQKNKGLSAARNRGFRESRGEYIQFLDADDILMPQKLQQQVRAMGDSEDLKLCYCDFIHGQADNPRLKANSQKNDWRLDLLNPLYDLAKRWETQLTIPPNSFLFDARIFREHRITFDEAPEIEGHEDWDCWMRIVRLRLRLYRVEQCLAAYRNTPNSMSKNLFKARNGFLAAIEKQLILSAKNPELVKILQEKRVETARRYARKIELSRFSFRKATKRFLRQQGSRLPTGLKSCIKAACRIG